MHCTYEEIADCVGTSVTTLQKRFKNLIEKGKAEGKKSLRRAQFEKALAGDARMLMFLGKNWLGQQDSPTDEESTQPLPWEDK
jgi:DNA-binding Lrp family transcriptional regulator